MRTPNINSIGYSHGTPPEDPKDLSRFLAEELIKVESAIRLAQGHLDKSFAAPAKPRDGDIRYADGTSWNPGSGAGIYWFNGSVWAKL